jgi:hypothetical protein
MPKMLWIDRRDLERSDVLRPRVEEIEWEWYKKKESPELVLPYDHHNDFKVFLDFLSHDRFV